MEKKEKYFIATNGASETIVLEESADDQKTLVLTSSITNWKDDSRIMLPNVYELTDKELKQLREGFQKKLSEKYKDKKEIPYKKVLLILKVEDLSETFPIEKKVEPEKVDKRINDVKKSIKSEKSKKIKPKNETREVIPKVKK